MVHTSETLDTSDVLPVGSPTKEVMLKGNTSYLVKTPDKTIGKLLVSHL